MSHRKLFSVESNSAGDGELLIDKLTALQSKQTEGMSVTADLIKQRNQLQSELSKELNKPSEDDKTTDPEDNTPDSSDTDTKDTKSEPGDKKDQDKPNTTKGNSDADSGDKNKEDLDIGSMDDLEAVVGSAVKDKTPVTESYKGKSVNYVFKDLVSKHQEYVFAMEKFGLESQALPVQERKIAYVKAEVLNAFKGLIGIAGTYQQACDSTVEKSLVGVKSLLEQVTIYSEAHRAEKLDFTAKMISDIDILSYISTKGKSDMRDNLTVMNDYLQSSSSLVEKLLTNTLEQFPDVFQTSGFKKDESGQNVVYGKMLPGFYTVAASFIPYTDYINVKYDDYSVYQVRELRTQDLYDLPHISLNNDKEFTAIVEKMNTLIALLGTTLDNLKLVSGEHTTSINAMKSLAYSVQEDQMTKLSDIDLDKTMKNFIKLKLTTDLYVRNVNMGIGFLTSLMSAFAVLMKVR